MLHRNADARQRNPARYGVHAKAAGLVIGLLAGRNQGNFAGNCKFADFVAPEKKMRTSVDKAGKIVYMKACGPAAGWVTTGGLNGKTAVSLTPWLAQSGQILGGEQQNQIASSASGTIAEKNAKKFLRLLQIGRVKG